MFSLFGPSEKNKKKAARNAALNYEVQYELAKQAEESRQKLAAPYTASNNVSASEMVAPGRRQNMNNKEAAPKECKLLEEGISTMKSIHNKSDMEYYFMMYGRIGNYLFPEIRRHLQTVPVTKYTEQCRTDFRNAFNMLVKNYPAFTSYFDLSPEDAMAMQRAAFEEVRRKEEMRRYNPAQYAAVYPDGGAKKRKTRKSKARKAKHTRRH